MVEDGVDNQRLIRHLLTKAGAQVSAVENGLEACQELANKEDGAGYDVVLMDMQMPVMDGYEATRHLRESGYLKPVIAMTAHAMTDDRQKCLDAGCDDYLQKPINRALLISTVAKFAQIARSQFNSAETAGSVEQSVDCS
jgi:CheY-like chemotaxis protein